MRRAVEHQVQRLRNLGRERAGARQTFEQIMRGTNSMVSALFGDTAMGSRTVQRSNEEFIPEALRLFDELWPAEITV